MAKYTIDISVMQYASMDVAADSPQDAVKKFKEMWANNSNLNLEYFEDELISVCCESYEEDGKND